MPGEALERTSERRPQERDVQVVLEITPKGSCFMEHIEGEIIDVELQFPGETCNCDVTVCREVEGRQHVDIVHNSGRVCLNCPGSVFSKYNLVPHFIDRTADTFVVKTYLPTDHRLADLVEDLRRVSHSVRVLRILEIGDGDVDSRTADVDLSQLTDKQREALELAIDRGYYESPPRVSLADLAAEFDVSTSALSQRLGHAEQTVMGQLFTG